MKKNISPAFKSPPEYEQAEKLKAINYYDRMINESKFEKKNTYFLHILLIRFFNSVLYV